METNNKNSSEISSYVARKRRISHDSHSSLDRFETEADTMDEDLQSMGQESQKLFRRFELKNQELEAHIRSIYEDLKAVKYENQTLKEQVNNLQENYDRLASSNGQNFTFKKHSREIQSRDLNLEKFVKDFEERCDLVESNNQDLVERLDSCQQTFDIQLSGIRQRLDNFQIHNINSQSIEDYNKQQNQLKAIRTDLPDNMNTSDEQFHENKDRCTLIEEALCTPCENQIQLATDEIQYGLFDVCDKYNVIVMKEQSKLKLFDYQKEIDERGWGELGNTNFATCIHWCSFLDRFLILYRFGLYQLLLKQDSNGLQMKLDDIIQIKSIRVYSLKQDTTNRCNNAVELLRFITTSPNLPGWLYLNRGYRRIELINTNLWKMQRGWSKHDLNYNNYDEIRTITCSYDGSYLAMNIKRNSSERHVDLRKHDSQLTLLKRIRMEKDSMSLLHRIQVPFDKEKWLVLNENNNQLYNVSTNPNDEEIIPLRTDCIKAIDNVPIQLCFVRNYKYLLVGAVIGDYIKKQGVLQFYKLPTS